MINYCTILTIYN